VGWPDGRNAPIQPPGVYDQNPRFQTAAETRDSVWAESFVGDCSKGKHKDRDPPPVTRLIQSTQGAGRCLTSRVAGTSMLFTHVRSRPVRLSGGPVV
jgi:hypothetical protein